MKMPRWAASFICLLTAGALAQDVARAQDSPKPARVTISGAAYDVTITPISPTSSNFAGQPLNGASGGRVNGLARGRNLTFYAASEWGGLFATDDRGKNWRHIDGHLPQATWDVEVDPSNPNRVYATSFYDGKAQNSLSGIAISDDGGTKWQTVDRTGLPNCDPRLGDRASEPSAFGIAIDQADSKRVYVGTNCGLALSTDAGANWTYVDPTPGDDGAMDVWDVVARGPVVDICGQDGFRRSTDFGRAGTWSNPAAGRVPNPAAPEPPAGGCSIAASPDETDVVFVTAGEFLFESDDGGATWSKELIDSLKQGRIPFVVVNKRDGASFDLYVGNVNLFQIACVTPATAGGAGPRCIGKTKTNMQKAAHNDVGDLAFDHGAKNACPALFSNDGGVYHNTTLGDPACHDPVWSPATTTTSALWLWDMTGLNQGGVGEEDLYFGNQDNGPFASKDAEGPRPGWDNPECCDVFDIAAEPTRVVFAICCWNGKTRIYVCGQGMANCQPLDVNLSPPGEPRNFSFGDALANFAPNSYVALTDKGVFVTLNIGVLPWTPLGSAEADCLKAGLSAPDCVFNDVKVSVAGGTPTFYLLSGEADARSAGRVFKYKGTDATKNWSQLKRPEAVGGFGIFDVDPKKPDRLIASYLHPTGPRMVRSSDGGRTWAGMSELDRLMAGHGAFKSENTRGPTSWTLFNGYPQPALVSFSPADPNIIAAGGADSGVFISVDDGVNWTRLTDPIGHDRHDIPRPRFAHWDHKGAGAEDFTLYLGTQGRGVWRIHLKQVHPEQAPPPLPCCDPDVEF